MALIDKETIRAEIERRLNNLPEDWLGAPVVYEEYMDILAFLDYLPEQPEVDLERDAVQFCFDKGLNITPYQAKTIASHYYELGCRRTAEMYDDIEYEKQRAEETKLSEDLEEEIDRFENWMETYNQADYPTSYTTRDIARHFAELGAKHLK